MPKLPSSNCSPRLCFVGAMAGKRGRRVTCQGQIISDLFDAAGYTVIATSARVGRFQRLMDIAWTLVRMRHVIDVAIVEVYSGLGFVLVDIASWLSRRLNFKLVLWLHGGGLPGFIVRHPRRAHRVLRRADIIVAPSNYLADAVTELGFQSDVIPNVIDLSLYCFRLRERLSPRLLWMRSFHPTWNPIMAVRVLARLLEVLPDATLVMAGQDKGLEFETRQNAETLGIGRSIRFPGFLDQQAKTLEGNLADIFINTNHVDNAPVALLEACAMGLPVVSTDVGGIPNLVTDQETALLVADDDIEAMVEAIQSLVSNPQLAMKLSANGRLLAERSSWEQVRPQWEQIFTHIMRRSHPTNALRADSTPSNDKRLPDPQT